MTVVGKGKEGLSLFSTVNRCRSAPGKKLLREWFLRPTLDVKVLNERFGNQKHRVDIFQMQFHFSWNLRKQK
jgi:DNA mismatch repair ATPase MutS